jgi:NitT/TauT family transport system permease protein/taurine transport system permease protein
MANTSPTSRKRLTRRLLLGTGSVLGLLMAWAVLTMATGTVSTNRFPSPLQFWQSTKQILTSGYADATLAGHALHSTRLVVLGFAVAAGIGVPLGLLMGWSRRAEALINPAFLVIRPIPPLAWIPLAILWLGLGDSAKIMVIFFAAFVPAVINTFTGVRAIEPPIIEAARMLGTPRWRFVGEVLLPAAAPMIFTGLRLSLQASWTTLVAAELVGALAGLGRVLNMAQQDIYPAMVMVGMAAVGILGWITTRLLAEIERRATPWLAAESVTPWLPPPSDRCRSLRLSFSVQLGWRASSEFG